MISKRTWMIVAVSCMLEFIAACIVALLVFWRVADAVILPLAEEMVEKIMEWLSWLSRVHV